MLKTLLAVTLALMLVFGLSGIAGFACGDNDNNDNGSCDCTSTVDTSLTVTKIINVCVDIEVDDFDVANLSEIYQNPTNNWVGQVRQEGMWNLSEICQNGDLNFVGQVVQYNWSDYANISTICQDGYNNGVGTVYQMAY